MLLEHPALRVGGVVLSVPSATQEHVSGRSTAVWPGMALASESCTRQGAVKPERARSSRRVHSPAHRNLIASPDPREVERGHALCKASLESSSSATERDATSQGGAQISSARRQGAQAAGVRNSSSPLPAVCLVRLCQRKRARISICMHMHMQTHPLTWHEAWRCW